VKEESMSELVVNGLVRKRAELAGEIDHTQARLRTLMTDVGSLDAAIRVFDPEYKVQEIRAKPFRLSRRGQRGEVSRTVLTILREANEPLTTRSVAEHITPDADAKTMKQTVKRVGLTLARQRRQGTVLAKRGEGPEMLWEVAREPQVVARYN
jgi:hypothetical protein